MISNNKTESSVTLLTYEGAQDYYLSNEFDAIYNQHSLLNERYQKVYRYFSTLDNQTVNLNGRCDAINMLDLVIDCNDKINIDEDISEIVNNVGIYVGGTCFDKLSSNTLKLNCHIYKRNISRLGGQIIIPLCLGIFHKNIFFPNNLKYYKVELKFDLCEKYAQYENKMHIYCNQYLFKSNDHLKWFTGEWTLVAHQTREFIYKKFNNCKQYYERKIEFNSRDVILNFHFLNPTMLLCFGGFDKNKVKNIILRLDGLDYYNGSLFALEHRKINEGLHTNACCIILSDLLFLDGKRDPNTINFSRVGNSQLVIETDEVINDHHKMYVSALSLSLIRYGHGMCGQMFTK